MQVPDAIYFMMRNTTLKACNLSSNVITKIPAKFPSKFSLITELNLSNNRMSTLPEEISECTQLERVDISRNSFIALPACLFTLPAIVSLDAKKNFVADVDIEAMQSCRTLETVNLEENPLTRDASVALSNITSVRVIITPRDVEEWEDLSI
jgi:Leucine-rich repeat (LRR) protein